MSRDKDGRFVRAAGACIDAGAVFVFAHFARHRLIGRGVRFSNNLWTAQFQQFCAAAFRAALRVKFSD